MVTEAAVRTLITDALKMVQTLSGRDWQDIAGGAKPIGDMTGFDSIVAIEATVIVEEKLAHLVGRNVHLDLGKGSIFIANDSPRALTLDAVVRAVMSKCGAKASA